MLNVILIIAILLGMLGLGIWYLTHTDLTEEHEEFDSFSTIPSLSKLIRESFSTSMRKSVKEMNLPQKEYNRIASSKEELKVSVRTAPTGDRQAKAYVLSFIKDILQNKHLGGIDSLNIGNVIHFDDVDLIQSRDRFEILTFLWLRDGEKGFTKNFDEYGLSKPRKTPYGNEYVVTEADIKEVYSDYMYKRGGMSYSEKIDFLTQRVYEETYGLGPVDLLLETDIDEVQGGTSGIPADSYEVKIENMENISYSFESIWIVLHGLNIHLKCTTFGTQKELIRVCRNIYRYNAPKILTKKDAAIISSMKNGNRVAVMCPNFSDSYAFLVRKFDSTPSLAPEKLL